MVVALSVLKAYSCVFEGLNTRQPQKFHAHIKFGPLVS